MERNCITHIILRIACNDQLAAEISTMSPASIDFIGLRVVFSNREIIPGKCREMSDFPVRDFPVLETGISWKTGKFH
jgi:hypothetical protein